VRIIFRFIIRLIKWILILALGYVVFNYITCPIYTFPDPRPFSGDKWYNPYQDVDSFAWRKANFQIQSYAWFGITGGRNNTNEAIDSLYRRLGYDVIATSDYMRINRHGDDKPEYVPVYEHGYGIRKWHQVVIGANLVSWRDYPLFQTLHHKQHIIDLLKRKNELVYIAHPRLRSGWNSSDFQYLTSYDGIEVLNYMRFSPTHWDAALSAGRYATILGNDDAHDITQPLEVGHRLTYLHLPELNREKILDALDNGLAVGADIFRTAEETWEEKFRKSKEIARVKQVRIEADTLTVATDKRALEFRFIGQNGTIVSSIADTAVARYALKRGDHYIRTEITFPDKNILYLNPVVRYDGVSKPGVDKKARVNLRATWIFWVSAWSVVILITYVYIRWRRRKKRKRARRYY
jgi:hypothetical protein